MICTFEYCSLYYLNQWLANDKSYCEDLANNNSESKKLSALKRAAVFYGVARNLPLEYDEKKGLHRYEPVLDIIDSLNHTDFRSNLIKKIREVEAHISKKYGGRKVLSLTTKFLWLKIKHPIIIYDSQSRIALGAEDGDLEAFYEKWRSEFEKHSPEIEAACFELPAMHKYAIDQSVATTEYIQRVSSEPWFQERVFDTYLWYKGSNNA